WARPARRGARASGTTPTPCRGRAARRRGWRVPWGRSVPTVRSGRRGRWGPRSRHSCRRRTGPREARLRRARSGPARGDGGGRRVRCRRASLDEGGPHRRDGDAIGGPLVLEVGGDATLEQHQDLARARVGDTVDGRRPLLVDPVVGQGSAATATVVD